jgi:vesicle transport through interaction with t-SNAREs protein 1
MELDEADEMVSQMEIEVQGIPQALRPAYTARIKAAKADLARSKRAAKDVHAQAGRSELLGGRAGASPSDDPYDASDRTRLLQGTATLEDGSARLRESERIALETEATGASILATLGRQREQIVNARETVSALHLGGWRMC